MAGGDKRLPHVLAKCRMWVERERESERERERGIFLAATGGIKRWVISVLNLRKPLIRR